MIDLGDLPTLDPAATLAAVESNVRVRREVEREAVLLLLRWCDLWSGDPQAEPGATPVSRGGDRLVELGGEGTPGVSDLCLAELAVARGAHVVGVRNDAAAALDLRHRLPRLWRAFLDLEIDWWLVREVARQSRGLALERVGVVDLAVHRARHESPGRIRTIAEAKVIEADLAAHHDKVRDDAARTGLWVHRTRVGARVDDVDGRPEVQRATLRLATADLVELDATVDELADALAANCAPESPDSGRTRDQWRAEAMAMLAKPHEAAAFLDAIATGGAPEEPPAPTRARRRKAVLYVHCHHDVVSGAVGGVARVEQLGPMLLEQVADLLRHREVTVRPVIDLADGHSVNGYEFPTKVRQRAELRNVYDVFPHSGSQATRRVDHDHATPYDPGGPPGQTGDHNDAPLTRYHHRAKTHRGYAVRQLGPCAYRWVTPHGLARIVTAGGTRVVEPLRASDGRVSGEIYRGPPLDFGVQ